MAVMVKPRGTDPGFLRCGCVRPEGDASIYYYRPRTKYNGRLCFQFVHQGGRGLPHLHPIILALVPCPFWEVDTPGPFQGPPQPGQDGVPPPPPPARDVVPPARTGWHTPQPAVMGYPPFPAKTG